MAGNLNVAYNWVISKCNDPNVGYSQTYREGQIVDGIEYYDCSSLMSAAVWEAGFYGGAPNPWFATFTEEAELNSVGFTSMTPNQEWKPGDILLSNRREHTEMVYQGRRTMGAHSSSYPLPDQVSINDWDSSPDQWDILLRYEGGGVTLDWIAEDRYLTQAEMENNATIVYYFYSGQFINVNTIAALLGNMQAESTLSPVLSERGGGGGYGLVQWTPQSSLIDHCNILGLSPYSDGDVQLQVILSEVRNRPGVEEWYSSGAFISPYYNSGATADMINVTGDAFLQNTMGWEPGKLAILFMVAYERPSYDPSVNHYQARMENARKWYEYITGLPPEPPDPGVPTNTKLPIWMYGRIL